MLALAVATSPAARPSKLDLAIRAVNGKGYVVYDSSTWRERERFNLLVGQSADDESRERAFFFVDGRLLNTDVREPSVDVRLASRTSRIIVLAYALYRPGDDVCCPHGGTAKVRFLWTGRKVVALDRIPSGDADARVHR